MTGNVNHERLALMLQMQQTQKLGEVDNGHNFTTGKQECCYHNWRVGARFAPHLPMTFHGAEFTDLHGTNPALLCSRSSTDFACDHQLRVRIAVQPQSLKLIQKHIFPSWSLHMSSVNCHTKHELAQAVLQRSSCTAQKARASDIRLQSHLS